MTAATAVVIDASIIVAAFTDEPERPQARRLIADPKLRLVAPELVQLEAGNAFWKRVRRREWTAAQHEHAMRALIDMRIELTPVRTLVRRAAQLSVDHDHPIYDCTYVALAQRERGMVATLDERLTKVVTRARVGLWAFA